MKRVFIMGVDGFDPHLAQEFMLREVFQKEWGVFKIDRRYFHEREGVPYTPRIWTSMITGVPPEVHGVKHFWGYGGILEKIRHLPVIRWIKGKRRILRFFGIKPKLVTVRDMNPGLKTIFDEVKPSVAVWVPGYNPNQELHEVLSRAFYQSLEKYIETIWWVHERRVDETLRLLTEVRGWRLFMTYFDLTDLLGHVCWVRCRDELWKAYMEVEKLVKTLKSLVEDGQTLFIVVTDHGMVLSSDGVTGNHSDYAFWSSNVKGVRINDFVDVPRVVKEWFSR